MTAPRQLPLFEPARAEPVWAVLDERARGTRFVALPVRSVLNGPASTGMGFWSVNPYVGCEFGCTYCYARDTHRYTVERAHDQGNLSDEKLRDFRGEAGWEAFERRILVKRDAAAVLTRALLQALAAHRGLSIGIITKSPLVVRDIDLLTRLARRNTVDVHMSIATADARLARQLEARSPVPSARLRALGRLTAASIRAGLLITPIIPGITDDVAGLSALLAAERAANAAYAGADQVPPAEPRLL